MSSPEGFTVRRVCGVAVISLERSGRQVYATFENSLLEWIAAEQPIAIILELGSSESLNGIDLAGAIFRQTLVRLSRAIEKFKGTFMLTNMPDDIVESLNLAGLAGVCFQTAQSTDEAIRRALTVTGTNRPVACNQQTFASWLRRLAQLIESESIVVSNATSIEDDIVTSEPLSCRLTLSLRGYEIGSTKRCIAEMPTPFIEG